jgi:flavin-binding protein dodecin
MVRQDHMYSAIQIVGADSNGWKYATINAIDAASETLRDLRIAEVKGFDVKRDNGKISEYRAKINLSFRDEK